MNALLDIPLQARLIALAVVGACAGSLINLAVYRFAWEPRPLSPWMRCPPGAPRRNWGDRIPIFGWMRLGREANIHGAGFWIRPMLVEILTAVLFAGLYVWEVQYEALLPRALRSAPVGFWPEANLVRLLHAQYAVHVLLAAVMFAASLIDWDEMYIPDVLTVPGTLVGLGIAAWYPWVLLPAATLMGGATPDVDFLKITSPHAVLWPDLLSGRPHTGSLGIALACYWSWCWAILPTVWRRRRGWRTALRIYWLRKIAGDHHGPGLRSPALGSMTAGGTAVIAMLWVGGGIHWIGLLTSLVGMVVGGGIIWCVRVIGSAVLGREAMGFGDVTLMAMIGTVVGWQPSLLIFFLAPVCGLVFALVRALSRGRSELCFGPFLCAATMIVIVFWPDLWVRVRPTFSVPWLVPGAMVGMMVMLAALLAVWMVIKRALEPHNVRL